MTLHPFVYGKSFPFFSSPEGFSSPSDVPVFPLGDDPFLLYCSARENSISADLLGTRSPVLFS